MARMVLWGVTALLCLLPARGANADDSPQADAAATYLLRYKFEPGETIRWKVVHRALVNTTVSGTSQVAETTTTSIKLWKILPADAKGNFRIEHSVEKVEMRQQLSGREEVVYNSETDQAPPPGFEDAAKSVGVPLSIFTIDSQGNVIDRQQKRATSNDSQGQIVVPLPAEAVPIGHTWAFPYDVQIPLRSGEVKQIKTRQHFELIGVESGIAEIGVETQVLTPVHDPEVEAQLIQRQTQGCVRLDLELGRIISQEMDLDRNVVGFSGDASSLHYVMRFNEEILPAEKTAGPEPAKPAPKAAFRPDLIKSPPQPKNRPASRGGMRR